MQPKISSEAKSVEPLPTCEKSPAKFKLSTISTYGALPSSFSQSTKKIVPINRLEGSYFTPTSHKVYVKSEKNTPLKLYIEKPGLFFTKKSFEFDFGSQIKQAASAKSFPIASEAPAVSNFPIDDSKDDCSSDSSRNISTNSHLIPIKLIKITSPAMCRICLDSEKSEDLISPCKCKGTQKFVHQECLKIWLLQSKRGNHEISSCELCHQPLKMSFNYTTEFSPCSKGTSVAWISCIIGFLIMCAVIFMFYFASAEHIHEDLMVIIFGSMLGMLACFCFLLSFASSVENCFDRKVVEWKIEEHVLQTENLTIN
ncbi:unnamed protein product [Blepharisma stoltei]|uniref:RING-CH-type domain-containing protein n=1 Tax=Blepharisma stoltei TaxID=1481888 RepID=A0AAU9JP25_9CILI|nr:unnamed protein product [Blepharisma stoltei]